MTPFVPRDPQAKITTAAECAAIMRERERAISGMRWVSTNGCFDILHAGHAACLHEARLLGDGLVVALNSDDSVRRLKGASRPVQPYRERALVLASLECVDLVVSFDEDTPIAILSLLRPQIHVKGGDYAPELLPEYACVRSWGGEVRTLAFTAGCSTGDLISRIRALPDKG
ncbi:MAG: D-glycero-beta-D-manno-heptose 1-phosphate adenylyltransferase [Spirochaetota bacterium]|jgi:rfaE bifunctional protein nucleotidyltransferase chain/domain|nr:D-glycero-beta-D-manno-heptose 1-phosphate adenylyltransferase [Spirochaetota bacterium]